MSASILPNGVALQPPKLWTVIFYFQHFSGTCMFIGSQKSGQKALNIIPNGLKNKNPHYKDLQVREGDLTPNANDVLRMADQPTHESMTILSVINCRRTSSSTLQVTTTEGSISNVSMDLDMVEGRALMHK